MLDIPLVSILALAFFGKSWCLMPLVSQVVPVVVVDVVVDVGVDLICVVE